MRKTRGRKEAEERLRGAGKPGSGGIQQQALAACRLAHCSEPGWPHRRAPTLCTPAPGGGVYTDHPAAELSAGYCWWWLLEQIPHYGICIGEWNQRTAVASVWKLHLELASDRRELDADSPAMREVVRGRQGKLLLRQVSKQTGLGFFPVKIPWRRMGGRHGKAHTLCTFSFGDKAVSANSKDSM